MVRSKEVSVCDGDRDQGLVHPEKVRSVRCIIRDCRNDT